MSQTITLTEAHIIDGVIDSIVDPRGMDEERLSAARRNAADEIQGFEPAGIVQTVLAGQCVMYDRLARDAMRDLRRAGWGAELAKARRDVLASGKMFHASFDRLRRMQGRPVDKTIVHPRVSQPVVARPESVPVPAAARPVGPSPARQPAPVPPAATPLTERQRAVLMPNEPQRDRSARSLLMNGTAVRFAMPPPAAKVAPAGIRLP